MSNQFVALSSLQLNLKPLLSHFSVQVHESWAKPSSSFHQLCARLQAWEMYATTCINTTPTTLTGLRILHMTHMTFTGAWLILQQMIGNVQNQLWSPWLAWHSKPTDTSSISVFRPQRAAYKSRLSHWNEPLSVIPLQSSDHIQPRR